MTPENEHTLAWLRGELEKHEEQGGHACIQITVIDGKAMRIEPGEKIMVQRLMKC